MKTARKLLVLVIVSLLMSVLASADLWAYEQPAATFAAAGGAVTSTSYINQGVLGQGMPLDVATAAVSGQSNLPGFLNAANARLDADGDLYANLFDNCWHIYNDPQSNFDGDVWGDACDPDDDNDQLADVYEVRYQLNPLDPFDAADDSDGDGVSNLDEALAGTDPTRVGTLLPGYRQPLFMTPLLTVPEGEAVDGQRPVPQ